MEGGFGLWGFVNLNMGKILYSNSPKGNKMILNLEEVQKTYDDRNSSSEGITCIAFYCMEKPNWYDMLTQRVNDELKLLLGDLYFSYGCHRHITIMGLEGISQKNYKSICSRIQSFPQIIIEKCIMQLLPNGLIVAEFFPTLESQVSLGQFRESFKEMGLIYKHPANIHKLHSVLGQILPDKWQNINNNKSKDMEKKISAVLDGHVDSFEKNNSIGQSDLKVVAYQQTSLAKSHAITCEDIF